MLRPWIEHCLESFGVDRCMFASNFPVDAMHGTFDELFSAYDGATADLDADARDKLFAANAERALPLLIDGTCARGRGIGGDCRSG